MKKIKFILPLIALFAILSCEKDNNIPLNQQQIDGSIDNPFLANFGATSSARFIGTVVNEENNPISGVTVSIGSSMTITDANGIFSVESATVYEKFAYIKASKNGFIDGSRSLVPTDGVNQVTIMLLDLEPIATIASGQAITIDLPNGTAVDFSGDFQTEFGAAYQGNVDVVLKHLNPDNGTMDLQMPGALIAENTNGDLRVLETYGMIAVELIGQNGEDLNIADGTFAEISIPLPSNATNPPATIPLWYFDEVYGYWKEEGFATLVGNMYVGEVSHFSFWNWDFQYPAVTVCITLVDVDGNPLPGQPLSLYSPALNSTGTYGYTNGNGVECGLVPQDDTMTLVVPNFGCVNSDFTETIGPFTTDTDITITVSNANALTTNVTGVFNDCDGNPATDGYVQFFYNDSTSVVPVTNGLLDLVIDYCDSDTSFSAQFFDLVNGQSTDAFSGNFAVPTTDLGTQMSCVDLADSDADGVLDLNEDLNGNNDLDDDDTDQDGTPDYLDADDDGDGVNTIDEDYDNDGNPMNEDSDGDQIPDYLDELDVLVYGAEVPGNGCAPNITYDLDLIITQYYSSLINNTYLFYLTEADANADVNPLTSPFVDDGTTQMIFVKATNIITNQTAINTVYLYEEYLDSDQDGLLDCEELTGVNIQTANGCDPNGNITDPNNPDSDGDGFGDCDEAAAGTDPNDPNDFPIDIDSDGDGVTDNNEINSNTDPQDPCDYEITLITEPIVSGIDCDGDGVTDADELDPDGDGTIGPNETDPNDPCDYNTAEVTEPQGGNWTNQDCDSDGLTNEEEVGAYINFNGIATPTGFAPTDPLNPDSDGDGVNDGDEIDPNGDGALGPNETDPNDPTDF